MEELSRNKLQEISMNIIYDYLTYISMGKEFNPEEEISKVFDLPYEECDDFVKSICLATIIHINEAIEHLSKYLIKWKFDRLNRVAQSILLLAYSNFYYVNDADKKVVINVAVKLSKKYLDDGDYKYINAVLDKALC